MSDINFNSGDVVRLKSGGPRMTVHSITTGRQIMTQLECDWFDDAKHLHREIFNESELESDHAREPDESG